MIEHPENDSYINERSGDFVIASILYVSLYEESVYLNKHIPLPKRIAMAMRIQGTAIVATIKQASV